MSKARVSCVVVLLLVLGLAGGCSRPDAGGAAERRAARRSAIVSDSTLLARVADSRVRGDYSRALSAAEALLSSRQHRRPPVACEVEAARLLVETLRSASALPRASQLELGAADSLLAAIETDATVDWCGGIPVIRSRLEVYIRLLGAEHPETARAHAALGQAGADCDSTALAAAAFEQALAIDRLRFGDSHPVVAEDWRRLAGFLADMDSLGAADSLYQRALGIVEQACGPGADLRALLLADLADLREQLGEWSAADLLYQRALALLDETRGGATDGEIADIQNNYAVLASRSGDLERGEDLLAQVVAFEETAGDRTPDCARALVNLAVVQQQQRDRPEKQAAAESNYTRALRILRADAEADPEREQMLAACLVNLGLLRTDRGELPAGEATLREALDVYGDLPEDLAGDAAKATLNLAKNLREQQRYAEAERLYREAVADLVHRRGATSAELARFLYSYGSLQDDQERYAEAETLFAQAASIHDAVRVAVSPGTSRARFQESPYPKLANARLRRGKQQAAWAAVEKYQGRILRELLQTSHRDTGTAGSIAIDSLAAGYPLQRIQGALAPDMAILGWIDVEERRGTWISWCYAILARGPVRWARIPEERDGTGDREVATRLRAALAEPPAAGAPEPDSLLHLARRLWRRVDPLVATLEGASIRRLVVIPSGPMLAIPVETLIDASGRFLGERFEVSYAPSATVHAWITERMPGRRDGGPEQVLLVGDPAFRDEDRRDMEREAKSPRSGRDEVGGREIAATTRSTGDGAALSGLRRLARSRDEVVSIGRCFASATILLGPEASEQRLMQLATAGELARYRVIHLATHARVDDLRPERSFLVLSRVGLPDPSRAAARGERSYDGLLRVQEMLEEWTLDADLVSLSACETALGKRIDGEGYVGFAQALFRVGARSLLASLWRVEDAATEKLMTRFYQNLTGSYSDARGGPPGQRMSKAAALGEAKAWLRETAGRRGTRPYAHPFFWSAFVLMGDPGGLR